MVKEFNEREERMKAILAKSTISNFNSVVGEISPARSRDREDSPDTEQGLHKDNDLHRKEVRKLESKVKSLEVDLSTCNKKRHEACKLITELKEDMFKFKQENELYKEKLRMGIKRAKIYLRDGRYTDLENLRFQKSIDAMIEVGPIISRGAFKVAYEMQLVSSPQHRQLLGFEDGVIKFCITEEGQSFDTNSRIEHDCKKQWYLSDMAVKFSTQLGLNPTKNRSLSFLKCAKVVLDDKTVALIEPRLMYFERMTNNDGDGTDNMDDILASFSHFVFALSGFLYLPCDFQGDILNMKLTDPEINTFDDEGLFLGMPTLGKAGVRNCLANHLKLNCPSNKYCRALELSSNLRFK